MPVPAVLPLTTLFTKPVIVVMPAAEPLISMPVPAAVTLVLSNATRRALAPAWVRASKALPAVDVIMLLDAVTVVVPAVLVRVSIPLPAEVTVLFWAVTEKAAVLPVFRRCPRRWHRGRCCC